VTYSVSEVFYSLQGEGVRAGTAAVFVRFAGCNLRCTREVDGFDCDTVHDQSCRLTVQALVEKVKVVDRGPCRWVVFTGGEPGLQVDDELVRALKSEGYRLAIETNGTVDLPSGLDWVTVSPKPSAPRLVVRRANEVRFVLDESRVPHCVDEIDADHYTVSPVFDGDQFDPAALVWCVRYCLHDPRFRLSVQQHKFWGIQ